MANNLDSAIQQIVSRAAAEIADAVRMNIQEEIRKVASLRAPAKPAGGKGARAVAKPAKAAKAPAGKKRRGVSEEEMTKVLDFIGKNPGKRGEEIRKALGLNQDQNSKILAKLRETKKVKTKGEKRATSYFV